MAIEQVQPALINHTDMDVTTKIISLTVLNEKWREITQRCDDVRYALNPGTVKYNKQPAAT